MWDHLDSIETALKLFQKPSTLLISIALFLLEGGFTSVDLLTNLLPEGKEMVFVRTFLEAVDTKAEVAIWVSQWLDDISILRGSSLESDLSSWMEEMRNRITCPKDAGMHLLLYCASLFSMQCMYWMKSHAFRVWMQTDPELLVPSVLLSLKKLKHLVSILNWPWGFVTPSVHVHSEHLEHTLKIMQFVCWEKNYIWFWWCARVLCFVYPKFQKIWTCRLIVYLQVSCYIWLSFRKY